MAIAFVRSTQAGTSGGPTSTIGFNVASTAGNALILQVSTALSRDSGTGDPYLSVISNISGTTFTRVASASIAQALPFYEHSQVWVATNIPAGTHVVTVNAGAGAADYGQLFLSEFSGVANVSVADVTGTKTGDSTLGQFDTTITTASTSQAEEVVIASFDAGGATDLSAYFSTNISTPAGFTSIGFDDNARLGNRAYSQSYRIINGLGPQTVSWGTIADPGAGEKVVWAANVATLKAAVSGLVVPGIVMTAPTSLIAGAFTGVRRGTPTGQTLAATSMLVAGTALGGKSATATMAGGFTFDSTTQPTFDQTSGYTFDGTATSDGVIPVATALIAGSGIGVPISLTGSVSFSATSAFVPGVVVGSRQSAVAGTVISSSTSLLAGTASAKRQASVASNTFGVTTSLIPGQNVTLNNASTNGVVFVAASSIGSQRFVFTFDSTVAPTFDRDNNYTFDAEPVSASQSNLPFGVIYARQTSLLTGTATATRLGAAGNLILPVATTVLMATPAIVAVDAIPGVLISAPVSFIAGSVIPQTSVSFVGAALLASSNIISGGQTSTVNAPVSGQSLAASASVIAGNTASQASIAVVGSIISAQSSILPAVTSTAANTTTQSAALAATAVFVSGSLRGQNNAIPSFAILNSIASINGGAVNTQKSEIIVGAVLPSNASLLASVAQATKSAPVVGRLLTSLATFAAGGMNGQQSVSIAGQTIGASTSYDAASYDSVQMVNRTGQTFLIRPELLAGQTTSNVNAVVNGQTLAAVTTLVAGSTVYFAAVTVLSQTLAAQSAFLAGTAVGKQLTRRNTGGRAFYLLQEFLQPIVGQELIFSEQNGPRPAKPYATLSVRSISEQEIIQHHLNGNGIVSLAKLQRMTIEVEYFGLGAFSKAQSLGLKLQSPTNVDRGDSFGISVSQIRGVTRVPELLNQSQYEERAIREFTAYIMVEGDDDVGLIEHAIIQDTDADHACSFDFVYEGHS